MLPDRRAQLSSPMVVSLILFLQTFFFCLFLDFPANLLCRAWSLCMNYAHRQMTLKAHFLSFRDKYIYMETPDLKMLAYIPDDGLHLHGLYLVLA